MLHAAVEPRWRSCVVAATGPSLNEATARALRGQRIIAVNDAFRLFPFADVLYGCDAKWWDLHKPEFAGEKWSSHGPGTNDKLLCQVRHNLHLIAGRHGAGFSFDPAVIHYGSNSGFQAINLALLFGCTRIILVGFDMKPAGDVGHFFGNHPAPLIHNLNYYRFIPEFEQAARMLPEHIRITNCTPDSALTCFEMGSLSDVLSLAA